MNRIYVSLSQMKRKFDSSICIKQGESANSIRVDYVDHKYVLRDHFTKTYIINIAIIRPECIKFRIEQSIRTCHLQKECVIKSNFEIQEFKNKQKESSANIELEIENITFIIKLKSMEGFLGKLNIDVIGDFCIECNGCNGCNECNGCNGCNGCITDPLLYVNDEKIE